ncbi:PREDICTED: cilia- and flagella-associated protein 97-like [Branchiostoma belcheri]|uniref:Cilia- and flagella-associated protein 97 n=1 Tax=Branchiostoma belcheri TaxID=7741 RepID=A0A6P4ZXI3_BRABE|nr:PREDICTED: cilia- and flagella-associated protein 97-like [Branchiostoma belcheri]
MEEDDLSGDVDFDFFEVNSTSHRSVSPVPRDASTPQKTADREDGRGRNVPGDQNSVRSGSSVKITAKIPTGSPRSSGSYSSDEFESEGEGGGSESDTGAGEQRRSRTTTPSHGKQPSSNKTMGSAASKHTKPSREISPDSDSPVESPRSRSSSRSSSRGRKPSTSRSRSRSSSRSSDSVTDVSPLSSPNLSPELRRKSQKGVATAESQAQVRHHHHQTTSGASRDNHRHRRNPGVTGKRQVKTIGVDRQGQERPMHKDVRFKEGDDNHVGEGTEDPLLLTDDSDTMELNRLLAAVLDMERRPRSASGTPTTAGQRRNMTFSNDEVRRIELENHRLLNEIIKKKQKRPMSASSTSSRMSRASTSSVSSTRSRGGRRDGNSSARIYHTALNRMRDQQRIERENLAMLRRLETARPTPGMSRHELLGNFDQQRRYFGNISKSKTPTPVRARRPLSAGASRLRTGPTTSSGADMGSPLHTTKPRPKSSSRVRPAWDSGW